MNFLKQTEDFRPKLLGSWTRKHNTSSIPIFVCTAKETGISDITNFLAAKSVANPI